MPVATIGLFALAVVVVILAFVIQRVVGDGDDGTLQPADAVATRDALNKTRTAQAGGGDNTPAPTSATQQPGSQTVTPGTGTPGTPRTGTATTSRTTTPGGTTYTIEEGDFCGTIAADFDITLEELLEANDMTEDDCLTLVIGEELIIPD